MTGDEIEVNLALIQVLCKKPSLSYSYEKYWKNLVFIVKKNNGIIRSLSAIL